MKTLEERKVRMAELANSKEDIVYIEESEAIELLLTSLELGHLLEPTQLLGIDRLVSVKGNLGVLFQIQPDDTISILTTPALNDLFPKLKAAVDEAGITLPIQEE